MSHVHPQPPVRTASARVCLSRLAGWVRDPGTVHPAAAVARVAAGLVFLGFGPGKFLRHEAEASAFERYGVPFPDIATYAVGTLEIVGGIALIAGLLVRPVALALAANLLVAVATAGRIDGGAVHLGVAPALIACSSRSPWWGAGHARSPPPGDAIGRLTRS